MTWIPDMDTYTMVDAGDHIRAIGWLSSIYPFPTGDTPLEFRTRLRKFARRWYSSTEALGWGMFFGVHRCELCGDYSAGGNFGVPSGELLFVAPEMVCHYVEAHRYRPPDAFIEAVMRSPLPPSGNMAAVYELLSSLVHSNIRRSLLGTIARYVWRLPRPRRYGAAVEPFRRLREQLRERDRNLELQLHWGRKRQLAVEYAARLALDQGGGIESIRAAGFHFLGDDSPVMCERIRLAMSGA